MFGTTEIARHGRNDEDGNCESAEIPTSYEAQEREGNPFASECTDDRGKSRPMPTNDETKCFANSVVEVTKSASETDERVDAE